MEKEVNAEYSNFEEVVEQIDFAITPNPIYLKIAKPTVEQIHKLLSAIKSCQEKGYMDMEKTYTDMIYAMMQTFIETPMKV